MPKRSSKKKSRDINVLPSQVIEEATSKPKNSTKNPAAVAPGGLGGLKGGKARAKKLNPEQRRDIVKKAARSRWSR